MVPRLHDGRGWRASIALCVVIGGLVFANLAAAGQQNAASIVGQVKDESGAVLPGVVVTAKSPALQVAEVNGVTDERGEYRLSPLPVGTYLVEYSLSGFQGVRREGVVLTLGFTAKLDEILKVGSLEESVVVSGTSPVVDVSSSASTTKLNRETLEILPTGRSGINDLLAQAPGTRGEYGTGGSNMNSNPSFRAFGQSNEYWSTLEGVVTTPPLTGGPGNFYDYSSMDESVVQTIGNDAEMPRRGVYLASIVKSGGNQLHGQMFWSQTNDRLQSSNIDDALRAKGLTTVNKLITRWDRSAQIGGKIVENKLWYFGSWRRRKEATEAPNSFHLVQPPFAPPAGTPPRLSGDTFIREGAAKQVLLQPAYTSKVSYQMSSSNRLVGFVQRLEKHRVNAPSTFQSPLSPADEQTWTWVAKGEWQYVHGNSMVFDFQHGYWDFDVVYPGRTTEPTSSDITTQAAWGDATSHGNLPYDYRTTTSGTISWYRPDMIFGNHDLKVGALWSASDISRIWDSRSANNGATENLTSGDYYLVFRNGAPYQFQALNTAVHPYNQDHYLGIFIKDGWTFKRRLTANLGLRFSRDNGFVPEQCRDAGSWPFTPAQCFSKVQLKIFNSFAPRTHLSYDVTGDGKTVIKGGWGRFDHMREITPEVDQLNPNTFTQTIFLWHDLNGNNNYDPGEVNLDPNGPDFVSISGTSAAIPNLNQLQPKVDEFSLSVERELIRNMAVRITGIYSRNFNTTRVAGVQRPYDAYNMPVTNPDPGPDGRVGTADDPGTPITYYDFPASLAGLRNEQTTLVNPPGTDHTYKSYEIAASKRLANNWQFNASYSSTLQHIPFGSPTGSPSGSGNLPGGTLPYTPNSELNTANNTREWLGKLSGAYIFPRGILGSVNFEHRSGDPLARQVLFSGGKQIPTIVLNVEPIGTRRLPNLNTLDLRAAKTFTVANGQKVEARVNIFNALNINKATGLNMRSGANFLLPTGIVLPRVLDISASYSF
jgi:Carboxypeptidase regulatory-like domain